MPAGREFFSAIVKFLETPIDESLIVWWSYLQKTDFWSRWLTIYKAAKIKTRTSKIVFSQSSKNKFVPIKIKVKASVSADRLVRAQFWATLLWARFLSVFRWSLTASLRQRRFARKIKAQEKLLFKIKKQQLKKKLKARRALSTEIKFERDNFKSSVRAAFSIVFTVALVYTSYFTYQIVFHDLPDISLLATAPQRATTKIFDRHHRLLFTIFEDENRTPVPLSAISPYLINATIAIEDQNFWTHPGFDIQAIIRAFMVNHEQGEIRQGASTITQQLVKLRLLTPEQSFVRKAREVVLAVLAERNFTKEQILEMYLNEVNYGGVIHGIEQAAISYFGKNARNLTLAEAAFLAAIPASPSNLSPFVTGSMYEAQARQREVLRRMAEEGFITQEQAAAAAAEELAILPGVTNIEAPHFVMYVRDLLIAQYGEAVVNRGGLEVVTTLDLAIQNQMQEIVTNEVNSLERMRISNGAAMMTNPQTGEILAMVGSVNYFDVQNDGKVNVTLSLRQPGSAIKSLTYALALERGFTPADVVNDAPVVFQAPGARPYAPRNYDGRFRGRVTLREALASSYNIPAVLLLNELGVHDLIDLGESMGITTWTERERFGLSLTLGGGEVRMIDLAQMYGAFANGGYNVDTNPILSVRDSQGNLIYRNNCAIYGIGCERDRVISAQTAHQITSMLFDNNARA
ncbi:MAG: transglycosylase domain-containing protein, partial [Pseudomonadales bacterium]|nr:transglycosylase domain-containing protein [Pseudomonadales bacterium]